VVSSRFCAKTPTLFLSARSGCGDRPHRGAIRLDPPLGARVLHATDSVAALHRLLDMGIENFLVTSAITGVLVRRICENCMTSYEPSTQELAFLQTIGGLAPDGGFVHGTGCNYCGHSGYPERIGVY
jgi:hypothetical protein